MTQEIGAYFFDSSLLDDKSDYYLNKAQTLVDNLLQTEEYQIEKQKILNKKHIPDITQITNPTIPQGKTSQPQISTSNQNALVKISNPHHQYTSNSTLNAVSNFKKQCLTHLNKDFKRQRTKTQNAEYLALGRKIYKTVNDKLKENLGKRASMMQETIDEVNSKRFDNQGKWLERYLELREEIKDHRKRIIALQKALQK
jgi:hypothetical protein